LSHLRVLELSRDVPAASCGRQFALWGAEVAVMEPEGGSPLRSRSPRAPHAPDISLLWCYLAAGKKAVTLPAGDALHVLLEKADVLVTDWENTGLARTGVSFEGIRRRHPHLHIVSVTPFGLGGPLAGKPGSALVSQALSGYMAVNGEAGLPPQPAPGHIASYAVGVAAFAGALASLWSAERTGAGEIVEVAEVEALGALTPFLRVHYNGVDRHREGGPESGVRYFPSSDGWVSFYPFLKEEIDAVKAVLEMPEGVWPDDLYVGPRHEVVQRVNKLFSPYTRRKTSDEIFYGLEARGMVCGKLLSPKDVIGLEQLAARGFLEPIEQPGVGAIRMPGAQARPLVGAVPGARPAPDAKDRIPASDLGWTVRARPRAQPDDRLPLAGIQVADFTQAWIGPFATMLMAGLGADVIKIESHRRPDVWRQASPNPVAIRDVRAERVNRSHNFNSVNLGKLSVALDLTEPEGRALTRQLIAASDIVAENYTPRVMSRFGLDFDSLREINPDIVMVSACGFGKTGPWADFKSNGTAIEALAGWDWRHRYPGRDPILMGFYQPDAACGFHMAALMLLGLFQRRRTGGPEAFDAAMLELASSHIGEQLLEAQLHEMSPGCAARTPDAAPNGVFPVAGEDRWIAISVRDDADWAALAALADAPAALRDDAFRTLAGRLAAEDRIETLLRDWTAGQDGRTLMKRLQAAGVPAGVVVRFLEAIDEPHFQERYWFQRFAHPDVGEHPYNGFPWRFGGRTLSAGWASPRLGEHSRKVLRERLGLSDDEVSALEARNVTGAVFLKPSDPSANP
jgi:crotonobetainyl-CoA:carnitine CoA-transferase CaiB-like acyl-CoA transferase